jgi:hypothetical protein
MRIIKVRLDPPVLPNDGLITLVATSYQIATDYKFENIIYKNEKDTTNLYYNKISLDVNDNVIIYIRVKYHFNWFNTKTNQYEEKETTWSRAVPVSENDHRLKLSNSIVSTPTIKTEFDYNESILTITSSDFDMYSGFGSHQSTTWKIEDLNNVLYFSREDDISNLTNIVADDNLDSGKIYKVMCKYKANDNTESNYGNKLVSNFTPHVSQFSFDAPEDFVNGRKFFFRIKLWTTGFQSYDLKVVNKKTNEEVISKTNQSTTTDYIQYQKQNYSIVEDFEFWVRLTFKDNNDNEYITEWTKVLEKSLEVNSIYLNRPKTTYAEKYDTLASVPGIYTNGITCISGNETFDNRVICSDFFNNTLWLYTTEENTLKRIKLLYTFENDLDLDYLHVIQMANHDILVDAVVYKDNKQRCSVFFVFNYDSVKQELTLLYKLERPDEKYCTSMSRSLVVLKDGTVWYVPAYLTNGKDEERQQLKLRRYNSLLNKIDKEIDLPFTARYNVGLFIDHKENVYIHSGSIYNKYGTESGSRVEYWTRDNNKIYKFDTSTEVITEYAEFPTEVPENVYCLHAFLRQDNKVVFFNACHSGKGLEYNQFIVLDLDTTKFTLTDINGQVLVPFRTNLRLLSGDIVRVSSKIKDYQNVLVYRSNTRSPSEIPDITDIGKESTNLIVADGETVVIEDIYKYNNIDIQGSGVIKWYRPQGVTILTSKTYICKQDERQLAVNFNNKKYDSVLILDGTQFTLTASNL